MSGRRFFLYIAAAASRLVRLTYLRASVRCAPLHTRARRSSALRSGAWIRASNTAKEDSVVVVERRRRGRAIEIGDTTPSNASGDRHTYIHKWFKRKGKEMHWGYY